MKSYLWKSSCFSWSEFQEGEILCAICGIRIDYLDPEIYDAIGKNGILIHCCYRHDEDRRLEWTIEKRGTMKPAAKKGARKMTTLIGSHLWKRLKSGSKKDQKCYVCAGIIQAMSSGTWKYCGAYRTEYACSKHRMKIQ